MEVPGKFLQSVHFDFMVKILIILSYPPKLWLISEEKEHLYGGCFWSTPPPPLGLQRIPNTQGLLGLIEIGKESWRHGLISNLYQHANMQTIYYIVRIYFRFHRGISDCNCSLMGVNEV